MCHVSSIWRQLSYYLRWSSAVEQLEVIACACATGSDVSHVHGNHVSGSGPDRKYVQRMHSQKLRNIRPSGDRK